MITASDKAIEKLQEWLAHQCFETGIGFRIFADTTQSGKPTSGIKLDRQRQGDEVTELDDIKVFLDPASTAQFADYELDYLEPDGGFVFRKVGANEG